MLSWAEDRISTELEDVIYEEIEQWNPHTTDMYTAGFVNGLRWVLTTLQELRRES